MTLLGKLPYAINDPKSDAGMPKKGDAVVICRPDGSSSFFLLDVDARGLLKELSDDKNLPAEELGQLEAAQKAMALWFASQNAQIMDAITAAMNASGSISDADFPNLN